MPSAAQTQAFRTSPRNDEVSDIFGTVEFPLKAHRSPHGRVTALSMMKDEGPYVLEWVAHHLGLGFTDIVVFTNDCSDGTDDMLIRLEELGLVHHRRNAIPEGIRPQPSALNHAQADPVVRKSDWLLVFDADEFLCIRHPSGTIDGLISAVEAEGASGIVITWRIFGSNGLRDWSRAPVTEQYLSAAPPLWNKGWGVKTLFRYEPDYWKLGIHRPKIRNKHLETDFPQSFKWLNGSGREMEDYFKFRGWRSIQRTVGYDWAQMNHYAVKSKEAYAIRKLRGNVNNKADKYNSDYWALQDRNEVHDDSALAHSAARQRIFEQLLTDPVLAQLHEAALDRVETRLETLRGTPDYADLMAGLEEASAVPLSQVEAKPPKARDPEKIAAQMSQIEKKLAKRPKDDASPPSAAAEPYVTGHIDLSRDLPLTYFDNHGLRVPADARVFSEPALQAIATGKFLRNLARRLPGLLEAGDSYLEVGTGAGVLPALLARGMPDLAITAQEERTALLAFARMLWHENGVAETATRRLTDTPLFDVSDGKDDASGLVALLRETACAVLFVNDPRLTSAMIATTLATVGPPLPRCVIAGPRATACKGAALTTALAAQGYAPAEAQPLNEALILHHG